MVILGLGSNIGDRFLNLRNAWHAIKQIAELTVEQVSPIYLSDALLPEHALADWDKPYLNLALRCETSLMPFQLLEELKKIEASFGRQSQMRHWGPRVIDIDILAWDDQVIVSDPLTVPHTNLQERPFAFWPLADIAPLWKFPLAGPHQGKTAAEIVEQWGSRFDGNAPFKTRQLLHRIDTPQLVGIINVTPDSFSDGGLYLSAEAALNHAIALVNAGATILDIGAESTAPQATLLTPEIEWQRLEPILSLIHASQEAFLLPPKISIDTRHAATIKKALAYDINYVNDVSGLDDPAMREVVAQSKIQCIIMHHLSLPADRNHVLDRQQDPVMMVYAWAAQRLIELEKSGIAKEQFIFDPGIGFGKTAAQSLLLLQKIQAFHSLGVPLFVAHSRKSFFSLFTQAASAERDLETTIAAIHLANQNVAYLRVHDVGMCARALNMYAALNFKRNTLC